ncbi:MAG: tetratricopeptide repeat protein [Planctomycetes bacterium]|nr:tetratricopeptide repeat protein [Planctomycetota bacterium]
MIERLERRAQQAVADADTPFDQGERLLRFLHETVLQGGYRADQTRISELLEKHTYNCVSSATIYNILGTRLGLDLRAIEVPDHAFSILYDGAQHVDVEATSAEGFDPSRDPRVLERFRNQTGFRYIPDRHPDQRREITNLGLVSLIYYNRGVAWGRAKAFDKALVCYLCALQLDREFASAIKNALATLANWSIALADQHRFDRALKVVEVGLKLAPQDAALRHNRNVIWQKSIEAAIEQGRTDEALARARAAKKAIPDGVFDDLQAWVFVKPAEEAVEKFRWDEALQFVETGMRKVDDEAREKLEMWVRGVFLRKARWHLERKEFAQSVAELEKGLTKFPDDKSMSRNLGFVALQWATNKTAEDGLEAGLAVLATLAKTHEGLEPLREAMHVWADRQATRLAKQGNYDQASQVYEKALDVFPGDAHLRQNCQVVWLQWAQSHMQARRWDKAASVLRQAAQRWPKGDSERNLAYLVQEWLKEAWEKQGLDGSARVAQKLLQRFPKTPIVRDAIRRHFLRQASRLVEQQEFQRALRVIERGDKVFGEKRTLRDGGRFVCDRWAGILQQRQQWREATEVYARGLARYPNDGHLKNNAVVTWNRWARTAIKKKDWKKAIAIYEEALKAFPSSALLKNNLRYCRQQAASKSRSVPSEP